MAIEIASECHYFSPTPLSFTGFQMPNIPVRFNAIHDMESLWWISKWFLFFFDVTREPHIDSTERDVTRSRLFFFGHDARMNFRYKWLTRPKTDIIPVCYRELQKALVRVAWLLRMKYAVLEKLLYTPNDLQAATSDADLHAYAVIEFERCVDLCRQMSDDAVSPYATQRANEEQLQAGRKSKSAASKARGQSSMTDATAVEQMDATKRVHAMSTEESLAKSKRSALRNPPFLPTTG